MASLFQTAAFTFTFDHADEMSVDAGPARRVHLSSALPPSSQPMALIPGDGGNNVLNGTPGADTIDGGAGADTMSGGAGNDTYYVDNYYDQTIEGVEPLGTSVDTVFSSISRTLGANLEILRLTGSATLGNGNEFANSIYGNAQNNALRGYDGWDVLDGGAGNDLLYGGTGVDDMIGGEGDDVFYVDNETEKTRERPGEGLDTVITTVNFRLYANIENLRLSGTVVEGLGNELDNAIYGNAQDNVLRGFAGNDTYYIDEYYDQTIEAAGEGRDTVVSSISRTLSANVEILRLTGAATLGNGNALANAIYGNDQNNALRGYDGDDTLSGGNGNDVHYGGAGNDSINGGAGRDSMIGGTGDDTYYADQRGDMIFELAREGTDTVFASFTSVLGANLEELVLVGPEAISGTGNELNNSITGNDADNFLRGNQGNDTLLGGRGNDELIAHSGFDVLAGGEGDDLYRVYSPAQLFEGPNGGIDRVISFIGIDLPDDFENLEVNGTGQTFNGNDLSNIIDITDARSSIITGGAGDDQISIINGGSGGDTIVGGMGQDTYIMRLQSIYRGGDAYFFNEVAESTGQSRDIFLTPVAVTFHFPSVPTGLAAKVVTGVLNDASFDADLAATIGAAQLGAGQAVEFDPSGGTLNLANTRFLIVDANGLAGYQAGQDYVVQISQNVPLTLDQFI